MTGHVRFTASRGADFALGSHLGTCTTAAGLCLAEPAGRFRHHHHTDHTDHTDHTGHTAARAAPRAYEWAAWVAPQVVPGFGFTSLVPSWNAATAGGSFLFVEARVSGDGVGWGRWFTLGGWAETDTEIRSASVDGQGDADTLVETDLLRAVPGSASWRAYQLRVLLARPPGSGATPSVRMLGAVVSDEPRSDPSTPGVARGVELPVPAYSQHLFRGDHPDWDSGGRSWCAPTSTAMVLGYWGRGPSASETAWVGDVPQPAVVDAARHVFDHGYGAGNWPFNAAYAARFGLEAFVTRLRSLAEAELFVAAGIPLVASVAFDDGELGGAGYGTQGHLLVIVGFDEHGDVVCNDPASHTEPDNGRVRVVYARTELERVWRGRPGGAVYVIHPADVPLPAQPDPAEPSW